VLGAPSFAYFAKGGLHANSADVDLRPLQHHRKKSRRTHATRAACASAPSLTAEPISAEATSCRSTPASASPRDPAAQPKSAALQPRHCLHHLLSLGSSEQLGTPAATPLPAAPSARVRNRRLPDPACPRANSARQRSRIHPDERQVPVPLHGTSQQDPDRTSPSPSSSEERPKHQPPRTAPRSAYAITARQPRRPSAPDASRSCP